MTHRALQVLQAIETALVGSILAPALKPDQTATVISQAQLSPEGDTPAPATFGPTILRLTVAVDVYVYELEADWLAELYDRLAAAQRAIMADTTGGTYDGLAFGVSAWMGETSEPDIDTATERSFAITRAEYFCDFRIDPTDPEL